MKKIEWTEWAGKPATLTELTVEVSHSATNGRHNIAQGNALGAKRTQTQQQEP